MYEQHDFYNKYVLPFKAYRVGTLEVYRPLCPQNNYMHAFLNVVIYHYVIPKHS